MARTFFRQVDSIGAPLTGRVNGDWTKTSRYEDDTAGPSVVIAELSASNAPGVYYFDTAPTKRLAVTIDAGAGITLAIARYQWFDVPADAAAVTLGNIADAVLDEAIGPHNGAGSVGETLNAAVTDGDLVPLLAAIIAGVWNEAMAGHVGAGTAGAVLAAAAVAGPSAAVIADAVWDEAVGGHTTSGSFGRQLGTELQIGAIGAAVWDLAREGHAGVGTFGEAILILQALMGRNYKIVTTTYSGSPARPTSAEIALFRSKAHMDADEADAGANRLATLSLASVFDALGRLTSRTEGDST